jgi:protein-S-isoprenylcysteine O-methyltransferase Ste14
MLFVFQVIVLVLLMTVLFAFPHAWTIGQISGGALMVVSAALLMTARWQLGKSFSVTAQARALVTHGIYSRIRNPIYVFSACLIAGACLFFQRPYLLLVFAILIPVQTWRAHQEARVLEAKFGDAYRQYRARTWF